MACYSQGGFASRAMPDELGVCDVQLLAAHGLGTEDHPDQAPSSDDEGGLQCGSFGSPEGPLHLGGGPVDLELGPEDDGPPEEPTAVPSGARQFAKQWLGGRLGTQAQVLVTNVVGTLRRLPKALVRAAAGTFSRRAGGRCSSILAFARELLGLSPTTI